MVREQNGAIVRLGDIADVVLGAEDYDTEVRFSGQTAVFMGIWPLPNANSLDVIKRVRTEMEAIQHDLPSGMQARIAYDATNYINNAIHEVLKTLGDTLLIVVVVIFLFLGSFRSVLIPVVAIPVSLIGAVFLMQVFGFTVNLLTLLAIVLSVGLVVDDAIVVVENVERHLGEGKSPLEAALLGARELVGPIIAMTITLAAVYLPIGLQGGLTGSLFREFAFTLAGAVTISGIVALTLSPVMSAKLLKPGMEEHGLAGRITRDFNRLKDVYGRLLDPTLAARPAVYTVWIVISLLTIPMFIMSAKELAPTEDQGVIFGILDAAANSTLDQNSRYAAAANQVFLSVPETDFTFQITFPTSGFGGMVIKPWDERERTVFQILPEVQQKLQAIPGIQMFPVTPPALPGGGQFPVEFVLASTAETAQILEFAQKLQQKAMTERHVRLSAADRRQDRPAPDRVRHRPRQGRRPRPQPGAGRRRPRRHGGRQFRQPLRHRRAQLQGHPADRAGRPAQPGPAEGHLRHRSGRQAGAALHRRHPEGVGRAPLAEPLPAAQCRQDQRRGDPAAGRGLRFLEDEAGKILPKGYVLDYTGESRQLRTEGNKFLPAFAPGGRPDLPGAGGPVQQLPRPLRHPGRLGAAGDVRRADLHLPEDARPQHPLLDHRAGPPPSTSTPRSAW